MTFNLSQIDRKQTLLKTVYSDLKEKNQEINYGCNGEETSLRFTVHPHFVWLQQQQKYEQSQPEMPQLDYLGIHNNINCAEYKCHPNLYS